MAVDVSQIHRFNPAHSSHIYFRPPLSTEPHRHSIEVQPKKPFQSFKSLKSPKFPSQSLRYHHFPLLNSPSIKFDAISPPPPHPIDKVSGASSIPHHTLILMNDNLTEWKVEVEKPSQLRSRRRFYSPKDAGMSEALQSAVLNFFPILDVAFTQFKQKPFRPTHYEIINVISNELTDIQAIVALHNHDLCILFAGTKSFRNLMLFLENGLLPSDLFEMTAKVEGEEPMLWASFEIAFESIRDPLMRSISATLENHQVATLTACGHSLGLLIHFASSFLFFGN